jgi:hypothetical protein
VSLGSLHGILVLLERLLAQQFAERIEPVLVNVGQFTSLFFGGQGGVVQDALPLLLDSVVNLIEWQDRFSGYADLLRRLPGLLEQRVPVEPVKLIPLPLEGSTDGLLPLPFKLFALLQAGLVITARQRLKLNINGISSPKEAAELLSGRLKATQRFPQIVRVV